MILPFQEFFGWAGETGKSTGQKDLFLHERTEMNWIINAMYPHVLKYWDQNLKYNPTKIIPVSSWANLHEDGDNTNEHSHSDGMNQAHVASVFYLEKEQGGDIEFCNPLDYIHRLTPRAIGLGDKILSETVACSTGDFLLFPGWLRHRTTPANGRRIAISINFNGMLNSLSLIRRKKAGCLKARNNFIGKLIFMHCFLIV